MLGIIKKVLKTGRAVSNGMGEKRRCVVSDCEQAVNMKGKMERYGREALEGGICKIVRVEKLK